MNNSRFFDHVELATPAHVGPPSPAFQPQTAPQPVHQANFMPPTTLPSTGTGGFSDALSFPAATQRSRGEEALSMMLPPPALPDSMDNLGMDILDGSPFDGTPVTDMLIERVRRRRSQRGVRRSPTSSRRVCVLCPPQNKVDIMDLSARLDVRRCIPVIRSSTRVLTSCVAWNAPGCGSWSPSGTKSQTGAHGSVATLLVLVGQERRNSLNVSSHANVPASLHFFSSSQALEREVQVGEAWAAVTEMMPTPSHFGPFFFSFSFFPSGTSTSSCRSAPSSGHQASRAHPPDLWARCP